ncbi:hypothetical protein BDR06DRAFT_975843 [Suillus hirtellus]|nr:hypothetical protein BDR06DRAFT_975843 [Suillus hirtellus]
MIGMVTDSRSSRPLRRASPQFIDTHFSLFSLAITAGHSIVICKIMIRESLMHRSIYMRQALDVRKVLVSIVEHRLHERCTSTKTSKNALTNFVNVYANELESEEDHRNRTMWFCMGAYVRTPFSSPFQLGVIGAELDRFEYTSIARVDTGVHCSTIIDIDPILEVDGDV